MKYYYYLKTFKKLYIIENSYSSYYFPINEAIVKKFSYRHGF